MTIPGEVSGRRFEVKTLPANELEVDPDVQRMLNEHRVRKLTEAFEESALGIFTVSAREYLDPKTQTISYRYVTLDGQTRLAALRRFAGTDETTLPVVCQVYYNLTRQQEAETFLSHNDRAAIRAVDKFRLAIVAKEQWALDLNRLVTEHGFEIGRGARPSHRFTAVAAARRIMTLPGGLDALNRTFDLSMRAWGHRRNSASAEFIDGVGLLYQRHSQNVDTVPFASKLAGSDTPQTFKSGVMAQHAAQGSQRTEAAYAYVINLYNKSRKSAARKLKPSGPRS
jgi:predicted anti-sigma-YlaC factor YlaD